MCRYLWSHISFRDCVCPGVDMAVGWWVCLEVGISKGGGYVQEGLVGWSGPMSIPVGGCACPGMGMAWRLMGMSAGGYFQGGGYVLEGWEYPHSPTPSGGMGYDAICPASGRYASYWNTCLFLTVPIQPTGFIVMHYLKLCYENRNWTKFNSFVINIFISKWSRRWNNLKVELKWKYGYD